MSNLNIINQNPPLDLLLLLLLIPAQIELFSHGDYFLIILLLLYMAATLWQPLSDLEQLPEKFGVQRLMFLLRLSLLFLMLLISPISVAVQNIQARLQADAGQGDVNEAYLHMHDGAYQVEMALERLTNGDNPYAASYNDSIMLLWNLETGVNPAVEHLIYLPGLLLLSMPFQAVTTAVLGFYDQRLLYLLAFVIVIFILPTIVQKPMYKLALIVGIGLNPWVAKPVAVGMNDIMIILCLLIAAVLLHKKHPYWAAIILGLACTMKQSAWLITPFFLLAIYLAAPPEKRWRQVITAVALIALMMIIIIGPLALWDLPAFIDDTFAYASGTASSLNYPIRGYTLGRLLVVFETVASDQDTYPFWRWQLLFGLPVLALSLYYQWRQHTLPAMFLAASFFIFALGFVSRYFQYNYVGFVVTLAFLGLFPTFTDKPADKE
ncbi:MAG: DUF2029 domain-containing protein [Chloroflexi bacterium]|nr:DUF2029 domain-containing protein [Chloroflexota bacterium]